MGQSKERSLSIRHYFVDEAGDGTLFDRRGRMIVGTEGCSRFFILGLLDVPDPKSLARELVELRAHLLGDPYFKSVPSMQAHSKKTALAFHAKDDVPEVRREVFHLLLRHDLRFFAIVRDKRKLLEYVRQRNERDANYHYHPNELYDYLARRLFKNLLHKDDEYCIYFARRGEVRQDGRPADRTCDCATQTRHPVGDRECLSDSCHSLQTPSVCGIAGCGLLPLGSPTLVRTPWRAIRAVALAIVQTGTRPGRHSPG